MTSSLEMKCDYVWRGLDFYVVTNIYNANTHIACFDINGRAKVLRRNDATMGVDKRGILHYPGEDCVGYYVAPEYIKITQDAGIPLKRVAPYDTWRQKCS